MKNGIYKIEFSTPLGSGTGAVELRDGKIFGSDSLVFYVGTYAVNGKEFTAEVETVQHSIVANGLNNVLGASNANLTIKGLFDPSAHQATLMGSSPSAHGLPIDIRLSWLRP